MTSFEQQLKDRLKVATNLQAEIASLRAEVQGLRHQMDSFAVEQKLFGESLGVRLRQKEPQP
jgi:hypothetical protein